MTSVKHSVQDLEIHCAPSNCQYSLNFVDCFPGAYIIVTIETKGIYVLSFLLLSKKLTVPHNIIDVLNLFVFFCIHGSQHWFILN